MDDGVDTLRTLHRVAAHILARRRCEVTSRFGLRASPGGIATPAFGEEPEVLRLTGTHLIREIAGSCRAIALEGATLHELAAFAGTDLMAEFSCGSDTPAVGDVDEPLSCSPARLHLLLDWYELGARVLDQVLATQPAEADASTVQLWPEHMDVATSVGAPDRIRANLGFSPGDGFEPSPYAYVGPWEDIRPGDPAYWNAPFGAFLRASDVDQSDDKRAATCLEFMQRGMIRLAANSG